MVDFLQALNKIRALESAGAVATVADYADYAAGSVLDAYEGMDEIPRDSGIILQTLKVAGKMGQPVVPAFSPEERAEFDRLLAARLASDPRPSE